MKARNELNLKFTTDVRTQEACKLDLSSGVTAEVFGDPENASYEWRLVHANGLVEQHSDCCYGNPAIAMRDALVIFYGPPRFGGDIVDLRPADHEPNHWGEVKGKASSITVDLIEAADNELNALRRDAELYRVLRENWLRIEQGSTVHRAGGLDLWCDERLPDSDQ
ncbi:Uncharacterized protein ALO43_04155 [Pseudomonas tremae]|uniref:Uncharacterized protein n=3 Tax=Pseudomonas syringae group TaxID=136849 RepID=Q87W50_PSESM|nr:MULTISPECIES: hypothetical protein [Pseudomonas syringae group]AAO58154.1 protein of unknown function [Pseudomonas syringae pv. tomato str. DC3000]KPB95458.1 Uncharacterized protein AC502_3996 [Pseudomonas syringae pv. maculicola]KPY97212.1 Uncharacterized protein ALO36_05282 [Pseudomonas syringae pv. tomato]KPY97441.1 Uncharacterized protein ALO43_04155 [Pseudomonas tremae]MBW8024741.1 hypothetical protein [Pseudomonas syringae pv. tomato]